MSDCISSRVFPSARRLFWRALLSTVAIVLGAIPGADVRGQDLPQPQPEDVTLDIDDGLELHMTYYAGPADKETIPILILHDWEKEDRTEYKGLAAYLQSKGHTVVVPDLRGHGDSTNVDVQDGVEKLNPKNFETPDYVAVIKKDLEAVREFLLAKHIAQELNLNKLFVVGAGDGALFGLYWALIDWTRQDWAPPRWNGKSVRGLVLISPSTEFKKLLKYQVPLANSDIQRQPSVLIVVGKNNKLANVQANKYRNAFERFHPPPPKDKPELTTFFYKPMDTLLQGAKLVAAPEFDINGLVNGFVMLRAAAMDPYKPYIPPVPGAVPTGGG
jgi:pimeloyl-ACP methyl ester carboxylesterase